MFKLVLEKAEEPEIKLPTSAGSSKSLQTINAGKAMGKGNALALLVEMQIDTATMEDSMEIP